MILLGRWILGPQTDLFNGWRGVLSLDPIKHTNLPRRVSGKAPSDGQVSVRFRWGVRGRISENDGSTFFYVKWHYLGTVNEAGIYSRENVLTPPNRHIGRGKIINCWLAGLELGTGPKNSLLGLFDEQGWIDPNVSYFLSQHFVPRVVTVVCAKVVSVWTLWFSWTWADWLWSGSWYDRRLFGRRLHGRRLSVRRLLGQRLHWLSLFRGSIWPKTSLAEGSPLLAALALGVYLAEDYFVRRHSWLPCPGVYLAEDTFDCPYPGDPPGRGPFWPKTFLAANLAEGLFGRTLE